ncbi:MAG: hypothetical protein QNJ97_03545 [Myxococcota bacterium]|nr:hypothetical protein [Myxococcota bacterium]
MNSSKAMTALTLVLITVLAGLCFGPYHSSVFGAAFVSTSKMVCLFAAFFIGISVVRRSDETDPNRRNWLILSIALLFCAMGQSVLWYHQTVLRTATPFPSYADLFFVAYCPVAIWALFAFCRRAANSGLSLGPPLAFWWPALAVIALSVICLPYILSPAIEAGGSFLECSLNIFYPVTSFLSLAPCAVILRFGLRFRGGRVFWIWSTLIIGYLLLLIADLMFAYFSMLHMESVLGQMDFLYAAGYLLVARAILFQREVLSFDARL